MDKNTGWTKLGYTACPECRKHGRDSKGDHGIIFQTEEGNKVIYCFRKLHKNKNTFPVNGIPPEINRVSTKSPEQFKADVEEVESWKSAPLKARCLSKTTADRFGVKTAVSELNGSDHVHYAYPHMLVDGDRYYKIRNIEPKFFFKMGKGSGTSYPFGWEQSQKKDTSGMKLILCEDQDSAMSVYEALMMKANDKWKHIHANVWAMPNGTDDVTWMAEPEIADYINTFKEELPNGNRKEFIINMDNDEAGERAEKAILKLYPWAKIVKTPQPYKDMNDLAQENKWQIIFNSVLGAVDHKPEGVVNVLDVLDDALDPTEVGKSYPLQTLTEVQYGQRDYMLMSIGGGTGSGKTLLAHEFASHNWKEHGEKSLMVMLEEQNGKTVKNVCGKADSVPYHLPDAEFNTDQLRATATEMNEHIYLWASKVDQDRRFNMDSILQAIRHFAVRDGIKNVFFDNVTAVTQHLSPTEINSEVGNIAKRFAGLAEEFNLRIFCFSHLNPPSGGKSHEEGAPVREREFTGSRALQRWSHIMGGFVRNKHEEKFYNLKLLDGTEVTVQGKNISYFEILKDREFGLTCKVHTCYIPETGRLLEYAENLGEVFNDEVDDEEGQDF